LNVVTKLFELIQLAPDRNLVAAAPDSQQNLMRLGKTTGCIRLPANCFYRPLNTIISHVCDYRPK